MKGLEVGIGILAYNEEAFIDATLHSLFQQSVFSDSHIDSDKQISDIEIIVVPNGCTDRTASVAQQALDEQIANLVKNDDANCSIKGRVHEIEQAGKANAWNQYIHDLSGSDLDLIVMIDADIEFNQVETIANSIRTLLADEQAEIVVDTPLKSIIKKEKKSLFDRISLQVSKQHLESRTGVAGSFYCCSAATLRKIWMPAGLSGEDAFIKAMVLTDMFRSEVKHEKLVRAENASHFYVPESTIGGIWRHELREIIGTALNCYLMWDFLLFATDPKGPGAGIVLKNLIERDPDWFHKFVGNTVRSKGLWVLPRGLFAGSIKNLKGKGVIRCYKSYIAVVIRLILNVPVCLVANYRIKAGKAIGFW